MYILDVNKLTKLTSKEEERIIDLDSVMPITMRPSTEALDEYLCKLENTSVTITGYWESTQN